MLFKKNYLSKVNNVGSGINALILKTTVQLDSPD